MVAAAMAERATDEELVAMAGSWWLRGETKESRLLRCRFTTESAQVVDLASRDVFAALMRHRIADFNHRDLLRGRRARRSNRRWH
jgi:hypothetical protein